MLNRINLHCTPSTISQVYEVLHCWLVSERCSLRKILRWFVVMLGTLWCVCFVVRKLWGFWVFLFWSLALCYKGSDTKPSVPRLYGMYIPHIYTFIDMRMFLCKDHWTKFRFPFRSCNYLLQKCGIIMKRRIMFIFSRCMLCHFSHGIKVWIFLAWCHTRWKWSN